jgi:hypothetical protein
MKVYCPTGKETFDDETTEEAPPQEIARQPLLIGPADVLRGDSV